MRHRTSIEETTTTQPTYAQRAIGLASRSAGRSFPLGGYSRDGLFSSLSICLSLGSLGGGCVKREHIPSWAAVIRAIAATEASLSASK